MFAWLTGFAIKKAGGFLFKYWKWILLALVVGAGYVAINRMVENYDAAIVKVAQLESQLQKVTKERDDLQLSFDTYKVDVAKEVTKANESIARLQREAAKNRRAYDELADKFEKHDLAFLAKRKPGLVAGIINRGTERLRRDIQTLTRDFATGNTPSRVPTP